MLTRYCTEAGLPSELSYRLSDFYIQKVDAAKSSDEIEQLFAEMGLDYAARMRQLRKASITAKPIIICLNYIYSHMHDKITVQDLANVVHLHPNYLSRLFQEQMGCSIHHYVLEQKIAAAKRALQFTDQSYTQNCRFTGIFFSEPLYSGFSCANRVHTKAIPRSYFPDKFDLGNCRKKAHCASLQSRPFSLFQFK